MTQSRSTIGIRRVASLAPQPHGFRRAQHRPGACDRLDPDELRAARKRDGRLESALARMGGDRELVVNKPYAAARVRPDGNVGSSTLDSSVVAAEFGQALAALPHALRPAGDQSR